MSHRLPESLNLLGFPFIGNTCAVPQISFSICSPQCLISSLCCCGEEERFMCSVTHLKNNSSLISSWLSVNVIKCFGLWLNDAWFLAQASSCPEARREGHIKGSCEKKLSVVIYNPQDLVKVLLWSYVMLLPLFYWLFCWMVSVPKSRAVFAAGEQKKRKEKKLPSSNQISICRYTYRCSYSSFTIFAGSVFFLPHDQN